MLTWTGSHENFFARTKQGEYQVHLVDPMVQPWEQPEPQLYIARFRNPGATDFQILEKWPLNNLSPEEIEEKRNTAKEACEAHFRARVGH
ncbi:MAG: hypothetical protein QM758_26850 [Armatimonas sp.]